MKEEKGASVSNWGETEEKLEWTALKGQGCQHR